MILYLKFDNIVIILGIIWLLATFIQIFYYLFFYIRIAQKPKVNNNQTPPVSVIICARNEEENLKKHLPSVLNQNYPQYEVIVVNDASEDNSSWVLDAFAKQYPHLKVSTIKKDEKFDHNKKLAITIGIKAANYEHLLFTDADCEVPSPDWIKQMIQSYKPNTEIVLGYGGYIKTKGFLNKLIRFDSLFIAMQYMGFAKAGIPYMGVGRNLSYKKTLFFNNKGFARHASLQSGDDDLFVNETANKQNTEINTTTHTRSEAKKSFALWIIQKKRHQTTFKRYKKRHQLLLTLEPLSRAVFYLMIPILLILSPNIYPIVLTLFILRLIILVLTYYFSTETLKEQDLLLYSPLFDFLYLFIDLIIKLSVNLHQQNKWK
ncbi:MAG: glycosyltransferase [Bacteroidales bacterium]